MTDIKNNNGKNISIQERYRYNRSLTRIGFVSITGVFGYIVAALCFVGGICFLVYSFSTTDIERYLSARFIGELLVGSSMFLLFGTVVTEVKSKADSKLIDSLPFTLLNYPLVLTWKSFPEQIFRVCFKQEPSEKEKETIREVLERDNLSIVKETANIFEIRLYNKRASKFDNQRRWLCVWFHEAIGTVFMPMNEKSEIKYVVFIK